MKFVYFRSTGGMSYTTGSSFFLRLLRLLGDLLGDLLPGFVLNLSSSTSLSGTSSWSSSTTAISSVFLIRLEVLRVGVGSSPAAAVTVVEDTTAAAVETVLFLLGMIAVQMVVLVESVKAE